MTKLRNWQNRDLITLENVIDNPYFKHAIETYKSNVDSTGKTPEDAGIDYLIHVFDIDAIAEHFNLPSRLLACLQGYIETDKLDPDLLLPSIKLVSELDKTVEPRHSTPHEDDWERYQRYKDDTEVKLILSVDTTRREMEDFIAEYWPLVESRITKLSDKPRKPVKPKTKSKRNLEMWELRESGMEYQEIAHTLNDKYRGRDNYKALTKENVKRQLNRMKSES